MSTVCVVFASTTSEFREKPLPRWSNAGFTAARSACAAAVVPFAPRTTVSVLLVFDDTVICSLSTWMTKPTVLGITVASVNTTLVVRPSIAPLSVVRFVPASIAGLPVSSACVCVGPPLLARGPSMALPLRLLAPVTVAPLVSPMKL